MERNVFFLLVWISEVERNREKLISLITLIFNIPKSGETEREKKPTNIYIFTIPILSHKNKRNKLANTHVLKAFHIQHRFLTVDFSSSLPTAPALSPLSSSCRAEEFLQTLWVSNLKGTSFGTASSSRGDYDWFKIAVISFFKLFGEKYDYELLKKCEECERHVGLYKECETNKLSDCDNHLERRPEGCSDFNKGTSFGTSSSSRGDYDWFETAVISFFKLFGEKYDCELLTKREECERLVGLYKEAVQDQ